MLLKNLRFFLVATLVFFGFSAMAQDKIYMTDGTTLQAKVKEVGQRNIVYTRWDNKEGAEYVVARRDVERIVFENGTEEVITHSNGFPRPPHRMREAPEKSTETSTERTRTPIPGYGNNILSVAPIQMTNESAAGIGVQYERILDKGGIFAIYLPVAVSFFNQDVTSNGPGGLYKLKASRAFTYVYPGVKIYPAGSAHRISYSVGPSFGLGFGSKYILTSSRDSNYSVVNTYKEGSVFKAGFIINNGLNLQPTKSLYVGLEFGFGIFYYNNEKSDFSSGDEPMVQFNFKMGYRF